KLCVVLLAIGLSQIVALPSPSLQINHPSTNFLQYLIQSRDLANGNGDHSIDCLGYYIPLINEGVTACLEQAALEISQINDSTKDDRDAIDASALSSCDALKVCSEKEAAEDYFECYSEAGSNSTKSMFAISANASELLAFVKEEVRLIQVNEYVCTNKTQRSRALNPQLLSQNLRLIPPQLYQNPRLIPHLLSQNLRLIPPQLYQNSRLIPQLSQNPRLIPPPTSQNPQQVPKFAIALCLLLATSGFALVPKHSDDLISMLTRQQFAVRALMAAPEARDDSTLISDCFNHYLEEQTNYTGCLRTAQMGRDELTNESASEREALLDRTNSMCSRLTQCDELVDGLKFFDCYRNASSDSYKVMFTLNSDSSLDFNRISAKYSVIETDLTACVDMARVDYAHDMDSCDESLTVCLNGGDCSHHSCSHHSCSQHSCSNHSCSYHSCSHHSCSHYSCSHHSCSHHSCSHHSCSHHSCSHNSCSHHSCTHHSCSHHSCSHYSSAPTTAAPTTAAPTTAAPTTAAPTTAGSTTAAPTTAAPTTAAPTTAAPTTAVPTTAAPTTAAPTTERPPEEDINRSIPLARRGGFIGGFDWPTPEPDLGIDECHDEFTIACANASMVYSDSYDLCELNANETIIHLEVDVELERLQIELASGAVCGNMRICDTLGTRNLDILTEISYNASRSYTRLHEDYDAVQRTFLLCSLDAQKNYMEDLREAHRELTQCRSEIDELSEYRAKPNVQLQLQSALDQYLVHARNLDATVSADVTTQCFNLYLPMLNEVAATFSSSYQGCISTANAETANLTAQADQQQKIYQSEANSDVSVIYDIATNAASSASSLSMGIQAIQATEYQCTNTTESNYVRDTAATYDLLDSCLKYGVPTTSSAAPSSSSPCFNLYMPMLNEVAATFSSSYQGCISTANAQTANLTAQADQQQKTYQSEVSSLCSAFTACDSNNDTTNFFNCYASAAEGDVSMMYDISSQAASSASSLTMGIQAIQDTQYQCTNATENKYVRDTASTYDLLDSCLKYGVPTTTTAPTTPTPSSAPLTSTSDGPFYFDL
ncbi:hypothetical protein M5D96_007223, partial [Drosophila gunungcola]